ncbi:MAG TPA: SOS response-associated peptidase [Rhodocyclaceae bacterium]
MCGRYALHGPQTQLQEYFSTQAWPDFPDRYNITPTLLVPVIRQSPEGQRVAHLLRWGLVPNWSKDPSIGQKLNNARGETVAEKPSFRDAFTRRRCIVPASGFYEWKTEGRHKQPYYIRFKSGEPLAMAGLWESWRDPEGQIVRTFCVITTGPNEVMQPIHERMPVLLRPGDFAAWLDPAVDAAHSLGALIAPFAAEGMEAWPVSRQVSNAREEGPDLIRPLPQETAEEG